MKFNFEVGKKKNLKVGVFILLILVAIMGSLMWFEFKAQDTLEVKSDLFTYELGEEVPLNASSYIVADKEKLEDVKLDTKALKTNDEDMVLVGKYELVATYKKVDYTINIKVQDTTAPTFVDPVEEITIEKGSDEDLTTYFKANDLSEVTLKLDDSKLDVSNAGTYEIEVIASDEYDNTTNITVKVNVIEKEEEKTDTTITNDTNNQNANNGNLSNGANNGSTGGNNGVVTPPVTPEPPVCVPGTPDPNWIGNSGLVFYSAQEYSNWYDWYTTTDEYWNGKGFDGVTIPFDTCGNHFQDLGMEVWTVQWH